jgi:ribonucleotide monophosphatase NagD (HAD superfamily)
MRDPIRAVLLDIDGVLSVGGVPIPGAREALGALKKRGIPFRCISNSTRRCRAAIAGRLLGMGFPVPEEQILTPAVAAASLLSERKIKGCLLLPTGDVARDFTEAGIRMREKTADALVVG